MNNSDIIYSNFFFLVEYNFQLIFEVLLFFKV